MTQVAVPTTLTTSPSAMPAPIASQCASKAPTGIGIPFGREFPGDPFGGHVTSAELRADAREHRIDLDEELFWRESAIRRAPEPLVAHRTDAPRQLVWIGNAREHRRDHVAMLKCGDERAALLRVVPQPVQ
jgi:hypothetical protein